MDVKKITGSILCNYDKFTQLFINHLEAVDCVLVFRSHSLKECIDQRRTYACSIQLKHKKRCFPIVWPIMIGSKLDVAIRKHHQDTFENLNDCPNFSDLKEANELADIAITCFVIKGICRHVPSFITNDATNIHVVQNKMVRFYRYTAEEKGVEICLYVDDVGSNRRGEVTLRTNDGKSMPPTQDNLQQFFQTNYSPICVKELMQYVYKTPFRIDHLGNKICVSPGHLFFKLFKKYLYLPLVKKQDYLLKKSYKIVVKSIESGELLHVLSKKTHFFKESQTQYKMVSVASEQSREIGNNDQVFVEKKSNCYREASFQNYQLIPYLSQMVIFQISSKVKSNHVLCFDDSYEGFLCMCGTAEAKNVGRHMMLARNVEISVDETPAEELLSFLRPEIDPSSTQYIVVNGVCLPVTPRYFQQLPLLEAKKKFRTVECYVQENFTFFNRKSGLLFKHLKENVWVTSKDMAFWAERYGSRDDFDFLTSYYLDLVPYFQHNSFPKNVLALNALKNSITAFTPDYSIYFRETVSAYTHETRQHRTVLRALNKFSKPWVLKLPKVTVSFNSFQGLTQEDCIVVRKDVKMFDCVRLYVLKLKIDSPGKKYFHPAGYTELADKVFLGTLVCPSNNLVVVPQTFHVHTHKVNDHVTSLYFTKPDYRLVSHELYCNMLYITVEQKHSLSYGDKLCSLHGQKGVAYLSERVPRIGSHYPDLMINPNSLVSRQTVGQILEMKDEGGDEFIIYNSRQQRVEGRCMIGKVFYFLINYLSSEHMYVAIDCVKDKIISQPVRGRSRKGGMRGGLMEVMNGFSANGLAQCYEEKLLWNSDRLITSEDIAIPKSVMLCNEDAKFFKCHIQTQNESLIEEIVPNEKENSHVCE